MTTRSTLPKGWLLLTAALVACSSPERSFGSGSGGSAGEGGTGGEGVGGAAGSAGSVGNSGSSGAGGAAGHAGSVSCAPGLFDCNADPADGCEASDVPRLTTPTAVSPLRGAYTGSLHAPRDAGTLRPAVGYSAVDEVCGRVRYEIEFDDSCTPGALEECAFDSPEHQGTSDTPTYRLPQNLPVRTEPPVGAFYAWRVRACDASARCSEWSSPAHLHVGRTQQDINGDGYADILATCSAGSELYFGGANTDGVSDVRLPRIQTPRWIGDLDGDGFADTAGSIAGYEPCTGYGIVIQVVYGAADLSSPRTQVLCRTAGSPSVNVEAADVGDMNADGFDDLGVAWGYYDTENSLMVFSGGTQVSSEPLAEASDNSPGANYAFVFGMSQQISGRGDYNGDGYSDVVAGIQGGSSVPGRLLVWLGAPSLSSSFNLELPVEPCTSMSMVVQAGDVDEDGRSDWSVLCSGEAGNRFGLLYGDTPAEGALRDVWPTELRLAGTTPWLDFDGDGSGEFLLGVADGAAVIWKPQGSDPLQPARYDRSPFARDVDAADHNGDGRMDVVFETERGASRAGSSSSFNVVPTALVIPSDATGSLDLAL